MRLSVGDCIKCTTANGNEFRLMYIGRYNNKSIFRVVKYPEDLEKQTNLYLEYTAEKIRKQFPYIEKEVVGIVQQEARQRMARKYMKKYKERKGEHARRKTVCHWD